MSTRANQVRIIGGQWRGRKLAFPDVEGLRPTSDRMRETLFNWLAPMIHGASCLDLFAGSGALGFEAASRGAARVVLVERSPTVARALLGHQQRLSAANVEVVQRDAVRYLAGSAEPFDIVFLDPPFSDAGLLQQSIKGLDTSRWLKPGAYIYLESPANAPLPSVPESWLAVKQKNAGQVSYQLYRADARE